MPLKIIAQYKTFQSFIIVLLTEPEWAIFVFKKYNYSRTVTEFKGKTFKVSNKIMISPAKHGMLNLISTSVIVNTQLNDHAMCFKNISFHSAHIRYDFWAARMNKNKVKRAHFFKLKHRYFGALENNGTIQNLPEFYYSIINGTRMSYIYFQKI